MTEDLRSRRVSRRLIRMIFESKFVYKAPSVDFMGNVDVSVKIEDLL